MQQTPKQIQTYSMVLWRQSEVDRSGSIEAGYRALQAVTSINESWGPRYIAAKKKREAERFDGTFARFRRLVAPDFDSPTGEMAPGRSRAVSFFSSMDDSHSSGIMVTVGVSDPNQVNSFVLHLPNTFREKNVTESPRVIALFRECITGFDPFWGALVNNPNSLRFNHLWSEDRPTAVHWLNYADDDLVQRIGRERICGAPMQRTERWEHGYYFQLTEDPLNDESSLDLTTQVNASAALGLFA